MTVPWTYKPLQSDENITTRHFDSEMVRLALCYSSERSKIQKYANVFGFNATDSNKDIETPLRPEVAKTIDDCLAGLRPDLDEKIWKNIVDILTNKDEIINSKAVKGLSIPDLAISVFEDAKLNLAPIILLILINETLNNDMENVRFFNHNGTSYSSSKIHKSVDGPEIYIRNIEISRDIRWYGNGFRIRGLPSTIVEALQGKKVAELITPPFLKNHDLTITDTLETDNVAYIGTDYDSSEDGKTFVLKLAQSEIKRLSS